MCSTASSWSSLTNPEALQQEYNSRCRPNLHEILPSQPAGALHTLRRLLDGDLLNRIFEALLLHRLKKIGASSRRGRRRSPRRRCEQLRYEVGEGGRVLTLVEDVRGED